MELNRFIQLLSEGALRYAWFLGAGASQSSGLPTAIDVMWDLKRRHYCVQEDQIISANDLQNTAVRDKISAYLQSQGFPEPGDAGEYSACFDLVFKQDHERQRRYLRAMLSDDKISLSLGPRILAAMMASGAANIVFTTNFDTVIEQAFAAVAGRQIAAFHLEGSYAANAALNNDEFPIYTKLHGDYRYQSLKNLADDLRSQNEELGKCLVTACNRFGLIVAGYSGRDESVMELLTSVLAGPNPFPHGLFWTTLKGRAPAKPVEDLIAAARAKGVVADIVEIETFDSSMSRIWRQLPEKPAELTRAVSKSAVLGVNLPVPPAGSEHPLLRMNALRITELPTHCFELRFQSEQQWSDLRSAEGHSSESIICTKETSVWAWGYEPMIAKAFGTSLVEIIEVEIGDRLRDLASNLFLKGFLEQAIALGLKRSKPLLHRARRSGSTLIVDRKAQNQTSLEDLRKAVGGLLHGTIQGLMSTPTAEHPTPEQLAWAEAVQLDLQVVDGRHWLLLRPDVWIWPKWARKDAAAFLDKRCGGRFNRQADALLSAWIGVLVPTTERRGADHEVVAFDGPSGPANPRFLLNDRTGFSRRPRQ